MPNGLDQHGFCFYVEMPLLLLGRRAVDTCGHAIPSSRAIALRHRALQRICALNPNFEGATGLLSELSGDSIREEHHGPGQTAHGPPRAKPPGLLPRASDLVAGARLVADSERQPVVTARWLYAGVKQGTREMARVGLAS